jgi:hypothetical protein
MSGRDFSLSEEFPIPRRYVDNDAPIPMRTEFIYAAFGLANEEQGPSERVLYNAVSGSLGVIGAVQPYGGLAHRSAELLSRAEWPRVFDIILRLAVEFERSGRLADYRRVVNPILTAHGVVWGLDDTGRLVRVLPDPVIQQVVSAVEGLAGARYEAARDLLRAGQDAFDATPRRDRDACANIFDAMESVGRTRFGGATFGDVLNELRTRAAIDRFTVATLRSLETVRHNHFGHGAQAPFSLTPGEVDFVYLTCIAGILLLVRID